MPYGTLSIDRIIPDSTLNVTGNVTVSGTISGPVSTITGNITLTSTSLGTTYICSGTSTDYAVILPAAAGNSGRSVTFLMSSALTNLVTITASGADTIDGSATRIMWAGESATLTSDGSNWYKVSGKTIPMVGGLHRASGTQSIGSGSVIKATFTATRASNCPTTMNDVTNSRIVILRPAVYKVDASIRFQNISSSSGYEILTYINGAEQTCCSRYMTTGDWGSVQSIYNFTCVVNDYIETYARQYSGTSQTLFTNIQNGMSVTEIPQW